MKKWQKAVTGIVITAAVLCAAGFGVYKVYIVPKVLEPAAEKAGELLASKDLQNTVASMAQDLKDEGLLDAEVYNQYFADSGINPQSMAASMTIENIEESDKAKAEEAANDMGISLNDIADGNVTKEQTDELKNRMEEKGVSQETVSKVEEAIDLSVNTPTQPEKQEEAPNKSEISNKSGEKTKPEKSEETKNSTNKAEVSKDDKTSDSGSSKKAEGATAYERIKNAATPQEFAQGASILSKIDIGTVQSLYKTDKAACKKYLSERLSGSEISTALSLYAKYSNLL